MYVKHSLKEYNLAMQLRREYKYGARKISISLESFGFYIKETTVASWIYKNKKPFNEVIISKIPKASKELTEEKSYVLGVLCGDGWISTGYRIGLGACDEEFVNYFNFCLNKIYERNGNISKGNGVKSNQFLTCLVSKRVVEDLLRYNKSFKTKEWKIPKQIKDSSREIQAAFLRAMFDSEGSIRLRRNGFGELGLTSSNRNSLLEIKEMLFNNFNIKSRFKVRKIGTIFVLYIYDYKSLKNFYENIGFVIKRKQATLVRVIKSYKRGSIKIHPFETKIKAIELLEKGLSHREIAKQLNVNHASIYDWEKRFRMLLPGFEPGS